MGSVDIDGFIPLKETDIIDGKLSGDWCEVSENYVAINRTKSYDFDPKSGTLKLNGDLFVQGELERNIGIEDAKQYVVNVPLFIQGYGSRLIECVRNIQYVPPDELKVRYSKPATTLSEIVRENMQRFLNLIKR